MAMQLSHAFSKIVKIRAWFGATSVKGLRSETLVSAMDPSWKVTSSSSVWTMSRVVSSELQKKVSSSRRSHEQGQGWASRSRRSALLTFVEQHPPMLGFSLQAYRLFSPARGATMQICE